MRREFLSLSLTLNYPFLGRRSALLLYFPLIFERVFILPSTYMFLLPPPTWANIYLLDIEYLCSFVECFSSHSIRFFSQFFWIHILFISLIASIARVCLCASMCLVFRFIFVPHIRRHRLSSFTTHLSDSSTLPRCPCYRRFYTRITFCIRYGATATVVSYKLVLIQVDECDKRTHVQVHTTRVAQPLRIHKLNVKGIEHCTGCEGQMFFLFCISRYCAYDCWDPWDLRCEEWDASYSTLIFGYFAFHTNTHTRS